MAWYLVKNRDNFTLFTFYISFIFIYGRNVSHKSCIFLRYLYFMPRINVYDEQILRNFMKLNLNFIDEIHETHSRIYFIRP